MKKYKTILSFFLTAFLFYFLLKDLDMVLFREYLFEGRSLLILSGVFFYLLSFAVRGLRWKLLTSHIGDFKVGELTMLTISGYAVNNIMPVRIGEFARAWVTGNRRKVSKTSVLASIFVERVFDGLTIAFLLFVILFIYPLPPNVKTLALLAFSFFMLLFLFIMFGTFSKIPEKILFSIRKKFKVLSFFVDVAEKFISGASSIKSPKAFFAVTFLSFFVWSMELVVYILISRAFGVEIPLVGYIFMLCAANLGMLAAPTPGGLAVFQAAIVYSLRFFAILYEKRMAVAVVLHMSQIIPVTILGLLWLWYHQISLSMIEKE